MPKFFDKLIAAQLRYPHGLLGNFILGKLNKVNVAIISETVKLLNLKRGNKVLDIGFGGGLSFELLRRKRQDIIVYGADISHKAINVASKKYNKEIAGGRLYLKHGSVESLPFDDVFFNHIISVNTVYFWDNLDIAFKEVQRVLKPGGKFVLSLKEKEVLQRSPRTTYGFNHYVLSDIITALEECGFVTTITSKRYESPFVCVEAMVPVG